MTFLNIFNPSRPVLSLHRNGKWSDMGFFDMYIDQQGPKEDFVQFSL